jgi:hypothetical protein
VWVFLVGALCFSTVPLGWAADDSQGGTALVPRQKAGRLPGKPAYLWLWYADGGPIPEFSENCGSLKNPPAYQCRFDTAQRSLGDCQSQVQAYLDDWYRDFNLVFTLTRPASNDYYLVVITSGWPECAQEAADRTGGTAAREGGIAPGAPCVDTTPNTAVAIACGGDALDCATIIAHEHGHLAGLMHTSNQSDLMYPVVQSLAKGFVNEDMKTVSDPNHPSCAVTQDSYRAMLATLGAWPGGAKPGLVFATSDAGAPDATYPDAGAPDTASHDTPDAQATSTIIGPIRGPTVDAEVTGLLGFDAYSRSMPSMPDAPQVSPPPAHSGCSLAPSSGSASLFIAAIAFLLCLLLSRHAQRLWVAVGARHRSPCGSQARDFFS